MAKLYTPAMAKIDRRKAREAKHRDPNAKSSPTREAWKRLKRNRLAIVGMIVLILIIIIAIIGPWIIPYDYTEYDYENVLDKPSAQHLMGTDSYGRDILSRLIIGTRISVPVGFLCVIAAFAIIVLLRHFWQHMSGRGQALRICVARRKRLDVRAALGAKH